MAGARHSLVWGVFGFLALALVSARVDAQTVKRESARPLQSVEGADTFKAYCAVCHGEQAKGNGPAAGALKKVPADLTTIAKRNKGTFSASDVEGVIMGTEVLTSHGSRDMPIWGPVFRSIATDDSFMKLRVSNLVGYLKSIQAP
jgi:mono/diheme cytochrome c family protein